MTLNDENNNGGDGWSSFWKPFFLACAIWALIIFVIWLTATKTTKQIEGNVNSSIDYQTQTEPVHVPKYDSTTQATINQIEHNRQMSHDHIDDLYDSKLQNALDSTFNQ